MKMRCSSFVLIGGNGYKRLKSAQVVAVGRMMLRSNDDVGFAR